MVNSQRKAQNPAEKSIGIGNRPGEDDVAKDMCVLEKKIPRSPNPAEGVDDTATELVELHLPDQASTFEQILAEIEKPTEEKGVLGTDLGPTEYHGHVRNAEEVVRDTLRIVGNGVVHVGRIGYQVKEVDYPKYAKKVISWPAAHPYQTAWHAGMGLLMIGPGLLAGPALSVAGFTSNGIAAGSAAAASHAALRTISSPSTFAMLQSAGAGGNGAPIVYGLIQAGSAASSAVGLIAATLGKGTTPGTKEIQISDSGAVDESSLAKEGKEPDPALKASLGKPKL
ncbi:MAG: hypothetical protein Q9198_006691 [Flavoplaca austrocitrina]